MTRKNTTGRWSQREEEAFNTLKKKLTEAPVLKIPDQDRGYIVTTDASDFAIGAVLSQSYEDGEHPIAFESRKMNDAEVKYPVHEREFLAVIHALRKWRHYLEGQRFIIVTDHYSLKYFDTQPSLSKRQARWLDFLAEFDYDIIHKPGKSNLVADALSRQSQLKCTVISELEVEPSCTERLKSDYMKDPEYKRILKYPTEYSQYKLVNGKIYLAMDGLFRLCIPGGIWRQKILSELHDSPSAGHFGIKKTLELIKRNFYWPTLEKDVTEYVKSCDSCQRNKPSNQKIPGPLQPLEVPHQRWERVSMDFIVHLPKTKAGHDALLVIVDYLTKMLILRPTFLNASAVDVARIFVDSVVRSHGLPRSIVSDRDSKFTSHFWKEVFRNVGTQLAMSSGYHPQTDGQTERVNRTIEEILRAYIGRRQKDWDQRLGMVEFAYNNAVHSTTGYSPFYLCYGRHPLSPATILTDIETKNCAAEEFLEHLQRDLKTAIQNIKRAQENQKKQADKRRRPLEFRVGDDVLLSTRYINTAGMGPSHKLGPLYIGPFKVLEKYSNAYKLKLPPNIQVHPVFHVSQLRLYRTSKGRRHPTAPPPPIITSEGHEEFIVDEIVEHRIRRRGGKVVKEYLVFWEGYPAHEATWEPIGNLNNAPEKLAEYHRRIEDNA